MVLPQTLKECWLASLVSLGHRSMKNKHFTMATISAEINFNGIRRNSETTCTGNILWDYPNQSEIYCLFVVHL